MPRPLFLAPALAGLAALGCGGPPPAEKADSGFACAPIPLPEDAPEVDELHAGGQSVICYEPAPVGRCRRWADASTALLVWQAGKGAIGCADGVVVVDGACPDDRLEGTCALPDGVEERWYACHQWSDAPDGAAGACAVSGGDWSDAG